MIYRACRRCIHVKRVTQDCGIGHDHAEQIVEVMRHTTCQLTDGLDLLRLQQPGLQSPRFGNILDAE